MPIPKVSVIIPVYNAEKYLHRCLESLFAQTLAEIEYIFIDDASPDNSFAILSEWIEQNDRKNQVKIIRHACNMGVSQSRQDGMDVATGEFIIHCDPDDWISENLLIGFSWYAPKNLKLSPYQSVTVLIFSV